MIKIESMFNQATPIIFEASRACYNGRGIDIHENMLKHIAARVKAGHESVLEHSNFIVALLVDKKNYGYLIDVLSACKYLYVYDMPVVVNPLGKIKQYWCSSSKSGNAVLINISGSVRGWKHLYKNINSVCNPILAKITKEIYKSIPKEYFIDMINDGVFTESSFSEIYEERFSNVERQCVSSEKSNLEVEMVHYDKLDNFRDYFNDMYIIDTPSPYMNMLNITIKFKNLSRYSTHQLVRHRDAITGESQRYVNFSDIGVNNPFVYDEDNQENVNKKFKLNLPFVDKELFLTPDEIGTMQHQIYNDLVKQGVNNETARGYLPQTTISGDYYMTFTRSNLCKFLDLRLDPHAQGEIREAANLVFDLLSKYPELSEDFICKDTEDDNRFNSLCRIALKPRYVYSNTSRSEFYDEVEDDGLTEEIYRTIEFEDEDGNPQVMRYEDIKVGTSKKEDV